jgi:hypothetical protein
MGSQYQHDHDEFLDAGQRATAQPLLFLVPGGPELTRLIAAAATAYTQIKAQR